MVRRILVTVVLVRGLQLAYGGLGCTWQAQHFLQLSDVLLQQADFRAQDFVLSVRLHKCATTVTA